MCGACPVGALVPKESLKPAREVKLYVLIVAWDATFI